MSVGGMERAIQIEQVDKECGYSDQASMSLDSKNHVEAQQICEKDN